MCGAALVSSFAFAVSGCAGETESITTQERVGQTIQPIIKGNASGTAHDAVVVLTNFKDGVRRNLCSATMVAPNLLITARHCVSDTESSAACTNDGTAVTGAGVVGDRKPGNLVVFVGKNGLVPDTEVEENGSARGTKIIVSKSSTVCNEDVAFLVLDKKIAGPIAPIRLGPPAIAEKVSAVGWGVDETGNLPQQREFRTGIPLIGIGPGVYPENPDYGYGDSEFMIGESACSGDSGGPTLSASGAVLGVASRAGNGKARDPYNYATTCMGSGAHAVYTHLGAHKELVTRAFAEAGEPVWVDGEADPRLPKPQADAPNTDDSTSSKKKAASEAIPVPTESAPAASDAGGCSMSSEPQRGSVEYAAGLAALLASLVGLRRRFRRGGDEEVEGTAHRERMPSLP
jgi:hypothetical protein